MTTRTDQARDTSDYEAAFKQSLTLLSERELRRMYHRLAQQPGPHRSYAENAEIHGQMIAVELELQSRGKGEKDEFPLQFGRALLLLVCILALTAMCSGCASTHTVLRIGLHADLTDVVNGCDRKLDAYCGLKGPRDIAVIEFLYLPTARFERTFNPYVGWLHKSHYSAGFPVNKEFEQIVDAPGVGGFIQFGGKK